MTPKKPDFIKVNGVNLRRVIRLPEVATDGTERCSRCGQVMSPELHDGTECLASFPPARNLSVR